ncbi:tubby C-terminal domain-like protein [Bacillus weihaiensis]
MEIARWKMSTTELFKTYLEIEDNSPIKEPEFFICLFQCIFYIGD